MSDSAEMNAFARAVASMLTTQVVYLVDEYGHISAYSKGHFSRLPVHFVEQHSVCWDVTAARARSAARSRRS